MIYLFDVMAEFDVNGSDKHQMSILEQNGYGQIKTSVKKQVLYIGLYVANRGI